VIDSVMSLNEVGEAHRRLEEGGVKGKIVLQVAE
jgi:NADPH:quinone reductase-like Zn-dependent oxidoreductase